MPSIPELSSRNKKRGQRNGSLLPLLSFGFSLAACLFVLLDRNFLDGSSSTSSELLSIMATPTKDTDNDALAEASDHEDETFRQLVGQGQMSCDELKLKVDRGELVDPNDGRIYARKIVDIKPSFFVSVHNESYDPMRWHTIFVRGRYYEGQVNRRFLQVLTAQNDALVLDVGANIGYYTLLSAALGHCVISFEVNPLNLLRMCESLTLNHAMSKVAIFFKGVYHIHGEVLPIHVPVHNPGQAAIMEHLTESALNTTTVTLDTFAQERGWFNMPGFSIAILKIDVEGKEPHIIQGSKRLLKSGIIQNIFTELRRMKRGLAQDSIKTLLESGYVIFDDKQNKRLTLEETTAYLEKVRDTLGTKTIDVWFQREGTTVDGT